MPRRRFLIAAASVLLAVVIGAVLRNQLKVQQGRQLRSEDTRIRRTLFKMLQPVALSNCQLERFGEPNDGGYLMCGNLLGQAQAGYWYGISGYDQWGCDISTKLKIRLHSQYDCFDTKQPSCPGGDTVFHAECVGDTTRTDEGRPFDTIKNQFVKNGDGAKHIVMKIDVEGAEWDSFFHAPDDVFEQIDQLAVEFHWVIDEKAQRWVHARRHLAVVERLKKFFHIAHLHFNNMGCVADLHPFTSRAYEVLFVSKRLGVVDPTRTVSGLHPLDAPNGPSMVDCQP